MFPSAFLISVLIAASPAPSQCPSKFTARTPALRTLFAQAAGFRFAVREGKRTFTSLVKRGDALSKSAARQLEAIHSAGCGASSADSERLDVCLAPLQWGCESIAPRVDWNSLAPVKKTADETLAYAVSDPGGSGIDLLAPRADFAGGCGDFGCAPRSVALPPLLKDVEELQRLATLASHPSFFGRRARRAIEALATTVRQARCVDERWKPSPGEVKSVVAHLAAARRKLAGKRRAAKAARTALGHLEKALAAGLPAETCEMPGY